jgi:predicted small lipoprotein YifL
MPRIRVFALAAGLAAVSLGLAGCGSDGDSPLVAPPATGEDAGGSGGGSGTDDSIVDGGLGECGQILKTWLSLATTAFQGQDAAKSAQDTLEGIKDDLPEDLQDDLQVVADAFGALADDGIVQGAQELTTSEFRDANENILGYLREDCLPG